MHRGTGTQVMPGLVHTPTRLSEDTELRRGSTVKKTKIYVSQDLGLEINCEDSRVPSAPSAVSTSDTVSI